MTKEVQMMLNLPDVPIFMPTLSVLLSLQLLKHFELRWTGASKFPIGVALLCLFRPIIYQSQREQEHCCLVVPQATITHT